MQSTSTIIFTTQSEACFGSGYQYARCRLQPEVIGCDGNFRAQGNAMIIDKNVMRNIDGA